jgi:membrane fusion protein (multidrug efflux system)
MAERMEKEAHATVRTRGNGKTIVIRIVVLVVLAAAASFGYVLWKQLSKVESTDDAQIDATLHTISSRISGHVVEVMVQDDQFVKAGDVLVQLDRKDYEVAVAEAKADLADAEATAQSSKTDIPIMSVTSASTLSSARSGNQDALAGVAAVEQQLAAARARLGSAQANVRVADANYSKAAQDVARYKMLVDKEEISKQQYDQAAATAEAARATLDAQRAGVIEAQENISGAEKAVEQAKARVSQAQASVESAMTGPQQVKVREAKAKSDEAKVEEQRALLEQAELNLEYTTIVAPIDGIVGKRNVAKGKNISAGEELMAIVPQDNIWVTANFKETQLKQMKVGQPVTIKVDAYGREYTGRVLLIAGASGARFSLLPPENATGNYVKVVQRIPVRIAFDPGQNNDHLLRPGMSVVPTVQVQ